MVKCKECAKYDTCIKTGGAVKVLSFELGCEYGEPNNNDTPAESVRETEVVSKDYFVMMHDSWYHFTECSSIVDLINRLVRWTNLSNIVTILNNALVGCTESNIVEVYNRFVTNFDQIQAIYEVGECKYGYFDSGVTHITTI